MHKNQNTEIEETMKKTRYNWILQTITRRGDFLRARFGLG